MNVLFSAIIALSMAVSGDDYSILPVPDDYQADFSLLNEEPIPEEPIPEDIPITDYAPDQFTIATSAAIVEFYDGAVGPTAETAGLLQSLQNKGYKIERVRVESLGTGVFNSRLAAYYKINKLPTFISIFDKIEVSRAEGTPNNEQLAQMFTAAKSREYLKQSILSGRVIYFGESSFSPCREARDLMQYLVNSGCNIRKANYDNISHRPTFERYGVEKYPAFVLIDEDGNKVKKYQGVDGLQLLRDMVSVYRSQTSTGPKLLDFWSESCTHCLRMNPIIDRISSQGYNVQKINTDKSPDIATRYGVSMIPVFVVLNSDGTESSRIAGEVTESTLVGMLKNAK